MKRKHLRPAYSATEVREGDRVIVLYAGAIIAGRLRFTVREVSGGCIFDERGASFGIGACELCWVETDDPEVPGGSYYWEENTPEGVVTNYSIMRFEMREEYVAQLRRIFQPILGK